MFYFKGSIVAVVLECNNFYKVIFLFLDMGTGKTLDGMAISICNSMYERSKVYCAANKGDNHPVYDFYQKEKVRLGGIGCKLIELMDRDGVDYEVQKKLFYTWEQLAIVQDIIFKAVDVPTIRHWVRKNRNGYI